MKRAAVLAALLASTAPLPAEDKENKKEITVEWIYSDEGEEPGKIPRFAWTSGGEVLLLDTRKPKSEQTLERVRVTGERRPAVNRAAALASLKAHLGDVDAPETLTWPESFDRAGKTALYLFAGDVFALDLSTSTFTRLTNTPEKESTPRISPDGRRAAYVRGNDLYVTELGSRAERRLTRDGSETILNGTLSWVYWEEVFGRKEGGFWWSEDSSAIAFLRTDDSPVTVSSFPDFRGPTPRVVTQRYPKAGEANPVVRLGIADAASGTVAFMDSADAPYEYVMGVKWLPDSKRVAVHLTNRAQTRLDLYAVDRGTGKAERLYSESEATWLNQKELHFLEGGKKLLVSSDRDGHTHLYLHEAGGKLVNQVTRGPWSVRGPGGAYGAALGSAFVDEAGGWVYFTSLAKSSVERHLYRVRLDGSEMERLTREDGSHAITFSPDCRHYFDVHSSHTTLPSLSLHEAGGVLRAVIAPARPELVKAFEMKVAELFTIPAADGFPMPARIVRPAGFDPARKYPVIIHAYGGPSAPVVRDSWNYSGNTYFDQVLARRGYLVVSFDNRSATGISKKLEDAEALRAFSDGELEDILAGVKWLKAQPWVDPGRVGIWGWSGGGTATLLGMTRSTEFKAGIAVAANTENRYYDTIFTEMYMRTPADNPEGYENGSLVKRAKDLSGRLLLVHGSGDDNVHPQHAWHVVDELVKAGKPFDLMIYPMRKHGIDDRPARIHLFNKMLEFWKLYL